MHHTFKIQSLYQHCFPSFSFDYCKKGRVSLYRYEVKKSFSFCPQAEKWWVLRRYCTVRALFMYEFYSYVAISVLIKIKLRPYSLNNWTFDIRTGRFYLRRYDERSRDYQSFCCCCASCCDIFLTFSFLEDFKSKKAQILIFWAYECQYLNPINWVLKKQPLNISVRTF